MKLVHNAAQIAARSHSMRAYYLSAFVLVLPEILYAGFQVETSPVWIWVIAAFLVGYGMWGRLVDQGISS